MTTESDSPTSILDAIKARLFSGENIRPEELSNAEAAVRADEIAREGRQHRAAEKAAKEAERRREQAKVDAAGALAAHDVAGILEKFDAAKDALTDLRTAIGQHNSAIVEAGKILDSVGLPSKSQHYGEDEEPHFDPKHYPLRALHDPQVYGVISDGVQHDLLTSDQWVHAAGQAAGAHSVSKGYYPPVLRKHLGIREIGEAA